MEGRGGDVIWLLRAWDWIVQTLASRMLFRRLLLLWAMCLTTLVILRVTEVQVLTGATAGGATIAVSAIGILATICMLYQYLRDKDGD
jgi:hypothetical protein